MDELLVCEMMTEHCVTYKALSRRADDYRKVTVFGRMPQRFNEMLHAIALSGLSSRVKVAQVQEALSEASTPGSRS